MASRFNLPWDTFPSDGASAPASVPTTVGQTDHDGLFQAWCEERHESIELRLCLDEAMRLIQRMIAEGQVTVESQKRARRLSAAVNTRRSCDQG